MKLQRPIVCALLILACVGVSSTVCLANDGTSITINGVSPRNGIGSSLYTATSKDGDVTSCTWSITNPIKDDQTFTGALAECENHGKDCYLTFHSFGTVTLNCSATVDVKGSTKIQSGSREIVCKAPPNPITPTLKIIGEDLVSLNSEHEYLADYSAPKGVPRINWTYPGITANNVRDITLAFNNLGTFRLNCVLRCTDEQGNNLDPVPDHKDIKVLPPVNLTALRASYENSSLANIPGEGIVKIHYNIDDDDESYVATDPNMGADCLQTAFKQNNTNPDDDLCKLRISFGNDIDNFTEGTVYIEITKGLRLWWNNMRTKDDDIFLGKVNEDEQIALSFAVPGEKETLRKIIQDGLYVEGEAPGYGCIKIRFADKKLKLPYWAYAVGGPKDQPNPDDRSAYKALFPKLVDCEWTVKKLGNSGDLKKFNCVAYAVDPNRVAFNDDNQYVNPYNGSFWVSSIENIPGYDSQPNPASINEPFQLTVFILQELWEMIPQETKLQISQNKYSMTPETDGYTFKGYKAGFLEGIRMAIPYADAMEYGDYLMSMNLFRTDNGSGFPEEYVEGFFTWSKWGLQKCGNNDENRKVVYYHGNGIPWLLFHAARAVKYDPNCKLLGENADPVWKVVVSKCGREKELVIHPENQVRNYYGEVTSAYK